MTYETVPLGSLCHFVGGGTPSKSNRAFYGGNIPWATVRDMKAEVISQTELAITDEAVRASTTNILPSGTVVIATRVGLGKVCIVGQATAINQDLRGILPKNVKEVDPRFLFWWLKSVAHLIVSNGTGATVQGVKLPFVASLPFPKMRLAEQRRIVAVLDEAFEGIACAIATTTRALTAADDMFSHFRDGLFNGQDDWFDQRLGQVLSVKHGFAFESKYFGPDGDYAMLTPGNFYESGGFRERGDVQKRYRGPMPSGFILEPSALLVAMTEQATGLLGSPLLVPEGDVYLHNQRLGLVQGSFDKGFIFHLFNTSAFRRHIQESATGTKVRHTSPGKIEAFRARFPPTEGAQADLAGRVDMISRDVDALVSKHRRKLAALAELKQSLLDRAFSGELTAANDNAFATPEQAANVMALMHWHHERAHRDKTYGHVKAQKGLHLLEWTCGVSLGRNPIKDAAGPNDFAHMRAAEAWANEQGFFQFVQRGGGYDFKKLPNYSKLLSVAKEALRPIMSAIKRVSDLIVPLDTDGAEALATVHAAWNNLLLDRREVTPEAIIREAREDWAPSKSKFSDGDLLCAIKQITTNGIAPDGSAKAVRHKQAALF